MFLLASYVFRRFVLIRRVNSPIFDSKHESGYSTFLTHAHWERYYLTTGYRLFSQHLGGTGKRRFGSVPLCSFTDRVRFPPLPPFYISIYVLLSP